MNNKSLVKLLNKKINDFEGTENYCKNKIIELVREREYSQASIFCSHASGWASSKEYSKALKKELMKK